MVDLTQPAPLSFIFGTIGVILVVIAVGIYLVKKNSVEVG
jgi:flagellar biogenesis protein FliO